MSQKISIQSSDDGTNVYDHSLSHNSASPLKVVLGNWYLIKQLVRANLVTRFRKSVLGMAWLFVVPIISVFIWILLNGAGVIQPGEMDIPYPAFVLLSTFIWAFFADLYKNISNVVQANGRLMIMTAFPRKVLVVERLFVHLIMFSIPFGLNILVLLFFGVKFSWYSLLFPFTLLPLIAFGLALGFIIALLRIVAIDLSKLFDEFMKIWMFLTPVVYTPKIEISWLSSILEWNPMTYLLGFSRDILVKGTFYEAEKYFYCCVGIFLFLVFAYRIYHLSEPKILERLIDS